ncbi:capsid cement protein [Zavarzinia compransoris]|uniref:DUF2190 domain-containing protein n=1 Tax=Zavarzinia compransoris TaxID=1264899 RepID=A0A317E9F6_9PROT|nr:capsid cement protein [Zavarzinia compransoris]PWR23361.1 DUF2190 domain-containing protein [Zavarzinia compransoris]TDP46065.1 hypothetical protein DES42_104146 [Zavarzinia compransoris]
MALTSIPVLTLTIKATAALTKQRFVTLAGAVPAAGAAVAGVARTAAAIGDDVAVDVLGTAVIEAGAAVAAGAAIESDASGRAITATTGVQVARTRTAAAAAGEALEIILIPN